MAAHGPPAGRRRRPRRGDHHEPSRVGGVRARRGLQRSDGRLPQLQAALPHRRPQGRSIRDRLPQLRPARHPDRATPVQPDVRHARGAGGGVRIGRLPAPGDGPGDVRAVRERRDQHAQEAAVRDRADRPQLPQRDHAGQLHLPRPRAGADGDGVLRPSPRRGRVVRPLGRRASPLVDRCARHRPGSPPPAPARDGRAQPLLEADHRHRVRVPDRLVGAGGHRRPHRLRPEGARRRLGQEARAVRRRDR